MIHIWEINRQNWVKLAIKVQSASHRKSTQVHPGPGQTESQVDPSFQLVSTLRLAAWFSEDIREISEAQL